MVLWRSPVETALERKLSARKRRQAKKGWSFHRVRKVSPYARYREPYRWEETGNTRSIFGELVEDACGAVWSSVWRRGS